MRSTLILDVPSDGGVVGAASATRRDQQDETPHRGASHPGVRFAGSWPVPPRCDLGSDGAGEQRSANEFAASDVDHDVAPRPRAADEDVSRRRRIERIGLVGDGPGDQPALAVVADAGAARPPDRHVARFRELEKALVLRGASERRSRCARRTPAAPCRAMPAGLMRCARRRGDHAGRQRRAAGKELGMDPVRGHAPGGQARPSARPGSSTARRDRSRPLAGRPARSKAFDPQVTCRVVVSSSPILRRRLAVPDLPSPASKLPEKLSHLRGERMRLAIARTVQPPDLPRRSARGQGMQHREHGRRADSRAQEHHRAVARLQGEAAARLADVEHVAGSNAAVQVAPRGAVRLHLDADAILLVGERSGERIAPEE